MDRLMTVKCGVCESATVNGYLCSKCEDSLWSMVVRAGITFDDAQGVTVYCALDELDIQMSRQARAGSRMGGRSAETAIPFDSRAAKAHATLADLLTSWARHYGAMRTELAGPRRCARWLKEHLSDITLSADSALMFDDLRKAIALADYTVDRVESKTYIGICSARSARGECGVDLYASAEASSLTCPQCGTVHTVKERRLVLLNAAHDMLLSAVDMVRLINSCGGHVTPGQVYKWHFRGRIKAVDYNEDGHPLYRLGDGLELAGRDGLQLPGVEG